MEMLRSGVTDSNADAAEARGGVIGAQGEIGTATTQMISATAELEHKKHLCSQEVDFLKAQLSVVLGDIEVMASVLEAASCETLPGETTLLVQCSHCNNAIYLQHDKVAKLLGKLQSPFAKQYVQNSLGMSFRDSLGEKQPLALAQEGVERLRTRTTFAVVPIPVGGVNTSDVPLAPEKYTCQPTTKCTIGSNPNCQKLKDRFLAVQAGIVDKRDELQEKISDTQKECERMILGLTQQIESLNMKLKEEQYRLAISTQKQNLAEKASRQKSALHDDQALEFTQTMTKCCTTQNDARSELCAIEKIRGELMKLADPNLAAAYIADCTVSDWIVQECSVTCGGGFGWMKRSVVVQPEGGGMKCPELTAIDDCNMETCPIDCVLDDWGGWSACSAKCGGGVIERNRRVITQPQHQGQPCDATMDEEACNIQDCSADCKLASWSEWSGCSKACGGGSLRRTKKVEELAIGTGECWESDSKQRIQFTSCNDHSCEDLLTDGRDILNCNSKVDIVIVLDGSASLGTAGWSQSTALTSRLVTAFGNGTADAKVAIELFSGPKTWDNYQKCTGDLKGTTIDMKEDCGIEWISHLTSNTADLADTAEDMGWPASTTMTSVALGEAEGELTSGREDANSVVIVITDGKPMSQRNTRAAAEALQEKAKLIWVPVGREAPIELIEELASKPEKDHVKMINEFADMTDTDFINWIVTSTCPVVS